MRTLICINTRRSAARLCEEIIVRWWRIRSSDRKCLVFKDFPYFLVQDSKQAKPGNIGNRESCSQCELTVTDGKSCLLSHWATPCADLLSNDPIFICEFMMEQSQWVAVNVILGLGVNPCMTDTRFAPHAKMPVAAFGNNFGDGLTFSNIVWLRWVGRQIHYASTAWWGTPGIVNTKRK